MRAMIFDRLEYPRIRCGNLDLFCKSRHQGFAPFPAPLSPAMSHELATMHVSPKRSATNSLQMNDCGLLNVPSY